MLYEVITVIGNVHFPIHAGDAAVLFQDDGGVVVKTGRTSFKEGDP